MKIKPKSFLQFLNDNFPNLMKFLSKSDIFQTDDDCGGRPKSGEEYHRGGGGGDRQGGAHHIRQHWDADMVSLPPLRCNTPPHPRPAGLLLLPAVCQEEGQEGPETKRRT